MGPPDVVGAAAVMLAAHVDEVGFAGERGAVAGLAEHVVGSGSEAALLLGQRTEGEGAPGRVEQPGADGGE